MKRYESEKQSGDASEWEHSVIRLAPDSTEGGYLPIELREDEGTDLEVFGVLVSVLVEVLVESVP